MECPVPRHSCHSSWSWKELHLHWRWLLEGLGSVGTESGAAAAAAALCEAMDAATSVASGRGLSGKAEEKLVMVALEALVAPPAAREAKSVPIQFSAWRNRGGLMMLGCQCSSLNLCTTRISL